eukprot:m.127752 g.127752  ORF g.127752 m.127752 type:complete len:257 (+) comp14717_c7_seq1:3037-3807(+)
MGDISEVIQEEDEFVRESRGSGDALLQSEALPGVFKIGENSVNNPLPQSDQNSFASTPLPLGTAAAHAFCPGVTEKRGEELPRIEEKNENDCSHIDNDTDHNHDPDHGPETRMGLCGLTPQWLQGFATGPWFLAALCLFTLTQIMAKEGFVPLAMAPLQTRYSLSSTQSGFLVSWHEIVFSLSVLGLAHFGHHAHIPHWLGRAMLTLALGSFLFALPQFVGGRYSPASSATGAEVCAAFSSSSGGGGGGGSLSRGC